MTKFLDEWLQLQATEETESGLSPSHFFRARARVRARARKISSFIVQKLLYTRDVAEKYFRARASVRARVRNIVMEFNRKKLN